MAASRRKSYNTFFIARGDQFHARAPLFCLPGHAFYLPAILANRLNPSSNWTRTTDNHSAIQSNKPWQFLKIVRTYAIPVNWNLTNYLPEFLSGKFRFNGLKVSIFPHPASLTCSRIISLHRLWPCRCRFSRCIRRQGGLPGCARWW